jgi:allantoicase
LISSSLSGTVLDQSDQWFAEASNLVNPKPPVSGNGKVVFTGGWYDGWETRRHNKKEFDYAIVKLGPEIGQNGGGFVYGVEIDTAFFNGNEAPAISVQGFASAAADGNGTNDRMVVGWKDAPGEWQTILSKQPCGPNRRQAWLLQTPTARPYTHVRLNMYPDGGIARFRLYGRAAPPPPSDTEVLDLALATNGGRCVGCSDEHFSKTSNLLLPGRGVDMGDGWETRRSRALGHTDWVVVRLGAVAGSLVKRVVVDTAHFRGNFPDKCQVWGIDWTGKPGEPAGGDPGWIDLSRGLQDCHAHTEHVFHCEDKLEGPLTHVKLVIVPDGGVKRLRVFGTSASTT